MLSVPNLSAPVFLPVQLAYFWLMIVNIHNQSHILPGNNGPIGVVLIPTCKISNQGFHYARTFVKAIGGTIIEITGGHRSTWELTKKLKKGCEIVDGSPERLIDVVKKKETNLLRVTFLVLDKAYWILDMNSILENVRLDWQMLLLSVTFMKRVEKVVRE